MENSIIGHILSRPCPHCNNGKIATTQYRRKPMCLSCASDMAEAAQHYQSASQAR